MLALGSGQIIQNPWVQLFCLAGWSTPLSTTDCHQALLQLQPKIYALQTAGKCNNKSHFMRHRRRNSPFIGNANVAQNWTWHLNGQLTVTCARSLRRSSSLAPWSGLAAPRIAAGQLLFEANFWAFHCVMFYWSNMDGIRLHPALAFSASMLAGCLCSTGS